MGFETNGGISSERIVSLWRILRCTHGCRARDVRGVLGRPWRRAHICVGLEIFSQKGVGKRILGLDIVPWIVTEFYDLGKKTHQDQSKLISSL